MHTHNDTHAFVSASISQISAVDVRVLQLTSLNRAILSIFPCHTHTYICASLQGVRRVVCVDSTTRQIEGIITLRDVATFLLGIA